MISIFMIIGVALATPQMNEREIHLKYFKLAYGENYENLKDLKFWYGNYHSVRVLTPPPGIKQNSPDFQKYKLEKQLSYLPTVADIKTVCKMKPGVEEKSESYKSCVLYLENSKNFSPLYEKPDSKSLLVGFFNRKSGGMYYRGDYIDLRPPQDKDDLDGNSGELSWRPFLAPVLDYKILLQGGFEREWMRLPTMGRPGEAWVGTTDVEGPLPILDLQRRGRLTRGNEIQGLGLAQLSETRLLNNSCYIGLDKGHVVFKQFIVSMNWNKSLRKGYGDDFFHFINESGPKIEIAEDQKTNQKVIDYFSKFQKFAPLEFRVQLVDFYLGIGKKFRDASHVAMSPGEATRNCDYPPGYFYKKIPKSMIIDFVEKYGGMVGQTFYRSGEDIASNARDDSLLGSALRGENMNEPFSVYIHQIHKGE